MVSRMISFTTPDSPVADLAQPLAVVCHDAGAANIILAWLASQPRRSCRPLVAGPAAALWKQRFGNSPTCATLAQALDGAAFVLTGTGWASDLEHQARQWAQARDIPSVAVLDHWVNYAARFNRNGETVLPTELWVTDVHAHRIALDCFPGTKIRLQPNLYLEEQLALIRAPDPARPVLLYVLEPARSTWGRDEAGEFQALDYFAARLPMLSLPRGLELRLRPHPSDPPGKYQAWIEANGRLDARLDTSASLGAAMSAARWVAGCESYAMAVAVEAGRSVFCTLPPWAPACRLPHLEILQLRKTRSPDRPVSSTKL